ncbi:MAG TPA: hypothetical protein VKV17_03720 [Bryobacteraceae bacterium]|nr:hypothetical protein [Bryobacteraceae bacterium]
MTSQVRVACLLALCALACAQSEGQLGSEFRLEGQQFSNDCSPPKFGCLQDIAAGQPLHLTYANLAPQNGVAFGPAFVYDKNVGESWRTTTNADAVVSTNESWRAGIYFKAIQTGTTPPSVTIVQRRPTGPTHQPPATLQAVPEFNFYAQAISLNQVNYYGLGQFTPRASLTAFGMREVIASGTACR